MRHVHIRFKPNKHNTDYNFDHKKIPRQVATVNLKG